MKRLGSILRNASFAILCLALSTTALAQAVPHKENTAGTVTVSEFLSPAVARQEFTARGNATHLGAYTQVGSHKIDLLTGAIYDGIFTSTGSDGSSAKGIYSGAFTINDDGTIDYQLTAVWLEGTGRLQGVTGIGEVLATATGAAAGSTFTYVTDAEWLLR